MVIRELVARSSQPDNLKNYPEKNKQTFLTIPIWDLRVGIMQVFPAMPIWVQLHSRSERVQVLHVWLSTNE